jgi:hypothetical protein
MLTSTATGLMALCLVLVFWVTVQHAWRRVFGDAAADPDTLAGRWGCSGMSVCGAEGCERRCPKRAGAVEEEER